MSFTVTVIVIGAVRERTGFGLNWTFCTISRSPAGTSAASTDLPPFGRLMIPPPPDASWTTAVWVEIALPLPRLFAAITLMRTVEPTWLCASLYELLTALEIGAHALPLWSHCSHW